MPIAEALVREDLQQSALRVALHIAHRLKSPEEVLRAASTANLQSHFPEFVRWAPSSIGRGNAGLCLLWGYLDCCLPDQQWERTGKIHIELAARYTEAIPDHGAGLFSGLSGLAFAGLQLSRDGTRYRRFLLSLDEVIASEAVSLAGRVGNSEAVSVNDFDVISGLSGIGAYLLCRPEIPFATEALAAVVRALVSLVTRKVVPPAWRTPANLLFDNASRASYPWGNLNCGLAHGVPGILSLLALVKLNGIVADGLDEAILTAGEWLAAHRLDDEWGENWPAVVPLECRNSGEGTLSEVDLSQAGITSTRSAWCYGSPGVARALWLAGRAMHREDLQELALSAMRAVFRRPIPVRMIDSPTFCHGVAGLLAVALRFANDTGHTWLREECDKLTGQIVASFRPDSLLGVRNLEYGGNETDEPGFLDGAAGVAAVLLAVATGIDPTWDRAFLLS